MKRVFTFCVIIASLAGFAQKDQAIVVKKRPTITISPDSMYFDSRVSRYFKLGGVPAGCTVKGDFNGYDIVVKDSIITLQPFTVFKESEVRKYNSKYLFGEKTTNGDFYTTTLNIHIIDSKGEEKSSLTRTCYIRPEPYPRSVPLSSQTADPLMNKILNNKIDSTEKKPYGP